MAWFRRAREKAGENANEVASYAAYFGGGKKRGGQSGRHRYLSRRAPLLGLQPVGDLAEAADLNVYVTAWSRMNVT